MCVHAYVCLHRLLHGLVFTIQVHFIPHLYEHHLLLMTSMLYIKHSLLLSLYRKFPWVSWESHGNVKYCFSSVGMGKNMGTGW